MKLDDLAILVYERESKHCHQMGKIISCTEFEKGKIYQILFADGEEEIFIQNKNMIEPQIKLYYRHNDNKGLKYDNNQKRGPKFLRKDLIRISDNPQAFNLQYRKLFKDDIDD